MKKRLPVNIDDLALTPRETKFVCEYVTNGYKADEAAKAAGLLPADAGMVASRLHCAKLLTNEKIKEAIRRTRDSFVEPYRDIHYAKIQEMLEVRAFYDIADFRKDDGSFKPLNDIPVKLHYAIDNMEEIITFSKQGDESKTIKYTLANRDKAMAELRALHEVKEEKKDAGLEDKRSELFALVAALGKGIAIGARTQVIEEQTKMAERLPPEPTSAGSIIKKIKSGDYGK